MSTTRSGDPDNVSASLAATIIDATNTTPIVVQTAAAHNFSDNDIVDIEGVVGNTGANGYARKITYLSTDTFSIDGSVGTGAWVSGGTVKDRSLTPTIIRPADGDLRSAASVNLAIDALADRTQFLMSALMAMGFGVEEFLASGTWTKPNLRGGQLIDWVLVYACGGGASGGGGGQAGTTAGQSACGGGGGGAAWAKLRIADVNGLASVAVTIGTGGISRAVTVPGGGGGPTIFAANTSLTWRGAGGWAGSDAQTPSNAQRAYRGGLPSHDYGGTTDYVARVTPASLGDLIVHTPGGGGAGFNNVGAHDGNTGCGSMEGFNGGATGAAGGDVGGYFGGGGGGGGGGGPFGAGGRGGFGGSGNNVGIGGAPQAGFDAAANSGAGGGGAGARGQGTSTGGNAGSGLGGSGRLYVIYPRVR